MDWSKGFTARYYAAIVDPKKWKDVSTFEITGGSIKLNDTSLRESADIECKIFDHDKEYWVRIYLDARQGDGSASLVPLFTGLASSPNLSFNGRKQSSTVQCYSVLKPAEDVLLPLGWYSNASNNGARVIEDLLKDIIPAPIVIEDVSPAIGQTIVAESGETRLSIIDYILETINWRMKIMGDGTIVLGPQPSDISAVFDADTYDVIGMNVTINRNWYDCPNVLRVINNDMTAIARDEDPDSMFSIQNRGREIWAEENSVTLNDQETIAQYAQRRLSKLQEIGYSLSYDRRFHPEVRPSDLIYIRYPEQNIGAVFQSTSQTIDIGYGAKVSEESKSV